jgi:integrase
MLWARLHLPEYRHISPEWIDTLRPPKMDNPARKHKAVTLETVRLLLSVKGNTLRLVRAKAACAFLFLSGIRATAFCTLPIGAIDLDKRTVQQLVSLGVKTKNRKNAVTVLLDILDLLEAVRDWDKIVRGKLTPASTWFAALSAANGGESVVSNEPAATASRDVILRQEVSHLFDLAGLPYMSPHKFRHGHATYGLKQARDIGDLKAISQNLMHANIGITDGIYAILSTDDMQERIASLGKNGGASVAPGASAPIDAAGITAIVEETIKRLIPPTPPEPARPRAARKAK